MKQVYRDMACYVWALCGSPDEALDMQTVNRFTEAGDAMYNEQKGINPYINAAIDARVTYGGDSDEFRMASMLALFETSSSPALRPLIMAHPDEHPDGTYVYGCFEGENATPTHMWLRYKGQLYDTIPGVLLRECPSNPYGNNPPSVNGNEPEEDTYRIQLVDLSQAQLDAIANPDLFHH